MRERLAGQVVVVDVWHVNGERVGGERIDEVNLHVISKQWQAFSQQQQYSDQFGYVLAEREHGQWDRSVIGVDQMLDVVESRCWALRDQGEVRWLWAALWLIAQWNVCGRIIVGIALAALLIGRRVLIVFVDDRIGQQIVYDVVLAGWVDDVIVLQAFGHSLSIQVELLKV